MKRSAEVEDTVLRKARKAARVGVINNSSGTGEEEEEEEEEERSELTSSIPVAVIGVSVPPTAASSSKPNPATLEEATAVAVLSQFQSTAELSNPQQPPPLAENSSTDLEKNSSHLLAKPTGQPKDDANYNALAATATRTTTIVTERPDNAKSSSSGSTNTQNTPPYRKAKNFAERLMIVLQDELAKDSLWWVGNGMGVAIHKKNLKRSPILKSHFNIGDFIVFSRNLNRWGFRRTQDYTVPNGVRAYACSLFRKDNPQLVHHMRMDSDVQDVFVLHADVHPPNVPFDLKATRATQQQQKQQQQNQQQQNQQQNQQQVIGGSIPQLAAPNTNTASNASINMHQEDFLKLMGNQYLHNQSVNAPTAGLGNVASNSPAAMNMAAFLWGKNNQSAPAAASASSTTVDHATLQMILGALSNGKQAGTSPAVQPSIKSTTRHEQLLGAILELTQEYLNAPEIPSSNLGKTIVTILQLLQFVGKSLQQEEQEKKRQAAAAAVSGAQDPTLLLMQALINQQNLASTTASQQNNDLRANHDTPRPASPLSVAGKSDQGNTHASHQQASTIPRQQLSEQELKMEFLRNLLNGSSMTALAPAIQSTLAAPSQQPQQQQQVRPQDIQAYLQFLQERQHQLNDGK